MAVVALGVIDAGFAPSEQDAAAEWVEVAADEVVVEEPGVAGMAVAARIAVTAAVAMPVTVGVPAVLVGLPAGVCVVPVVPVPLVPAVAVALGPICMWVAPY